MGEVNLLLRGGTYLRDGSLNVFQAGLAKLLGNKGIGSGTEDWPSLSEGIEHFQGMSFGAKSRSAGFIESLLNRMMMLEQAFPATSNVGASDMLPALAARSVVFRLHGMTGVPLQFLAGFLLLWLARYREGADAGEGHMVIIEEAHMLSSDKMRQDIGEGILCRMFRTARKRSIALVLCDQVPSEMPQPILANLGCRIVMRLVGARCIWAIQSSMGLDRQQAEAIPELLPRQAIVQYQSHPTPFLIQVPELKFPDKPHESELLPLAEALLGQVRWREATAPAGQGKAAAQAAPAATGQAGLGGETLLVMMRICEHPAESIEQRCEALRMDRSAEFRARHELDTRGLVEKVGQTIGGKVSFYQLTLKGLEWAEAHCVKVRKFKSGIVHEYLLSQVERRIGLVGPKWRLQRNSQIAHDQGLQPDMLAMGPDGCRIIVEICCNNFDYDAENILTEAAITDVDQVIALAPDKKTRQSLEKALAKAATLFKHVNLAKVAVLDSVQCLAPEFDWAAMLAGPNGCATAQTGGGGKTTRP